MRQASLVLAVALSLGGCAVQNAEEQATIPSGARTIEAVRVSAPPVLDGKLDDACWKKAKPVTGFLCMNSYLEASFQSIGYICYDDSNLYIGMKCLMPEGGTPAGKTQPHDTYLFSDDIVEIMLDPGRTQLNYYQLVVSAYGATWDAARKSGGAQLDVTWDGDWTGKSCIGDGYWSTEMAVPFHALGVSPDMGKLWGINLCREAKRPRDEWSTIGARGTFNSASDFAILEGIDVNFRPYQFQIGPAVTKLEPGEGPPRALFGLPVTNKTGRARKVKLDRCYTEADGKEATESRIVTLEQNGTEIIATERLEVEPLLPGRTDGYVVRSAPATTKITVTDADDGRILAVSQAKRPWFFEPIQIEAKDPWQREMPAGQTSAVSMKVRTSLSKERLLKGELVVTLAPMETDAVVAEKRIPHPSELEEVTFSTADLPWGAYDVRAALKDDQGREVVSTRSLATVLPGGKQRIKVLNNMVSELLNTAERGMVGEKEIEFMNPRDGWVFFSLSAGGRARLDSEAEPLPAWRAGSNPAETMRLLKAGRHALHLEGQPQQVIVRAVPALFYSCHPGPFAWEFLKEHVLADCNTILGHAGHVDADAREWAATGRTWLSFACAPGHGVGGEDFYTGERYYEALLASEGFSHPAARGVMVDQIGSSSVAQKIEFARALTRILQNPAASGHGFHPWYEGLVFGSEGDLAFMKVVLEAGWPFSYYVYLIEQNTEELVRADIQATIVRLALSADRQIPGSLRRAIVTLGYWSDVALGLIQDVDPGANFKVLMQIQQETLANDPALFGLYGVFWYYSPYVDEEILRWSAALYRHYGIEGKTTPLTSDPYRLPHIKNGDFAEGVQGWALTEAEAGAIGVHHLAGYGSLQGRYVGGTRGDSFLVTKRSAQGPNSFSQEIRNLTSGRAYSLKMITANYRNIIEEKSVKEDDAISIALANVDLIERAGKNQSQSKPNHYGFPLGKFRGDYYAYMNYHWYVFRAKGDTARLTVSDWAGAEKPGGPVGQEVMYNYIQVEPYLEDAR